MVVLEEKGQLNIMKKLATNEQKDINRQLAKVVDVLNKSLDRLEKAGFADKSKFYTDVMAAYRRGAPYLHITKDGKVRYGTSYLKATDIDNRKSLLKKLSNYTTYNTRTIKGIKEQSKKKLATIESVMPELKGKINTSDVDHINDIFKMLREKAYLDHYGSGDAWENVDKLKDKSSQEILNALNNIAEAEAQTQRGRIADSKALDELIGKTTNFK